MPCSKRVFSIFLITLFASGNSAVAGLRDDIDRLIRNAALKGGTVAVSVRDCATSKPLIAVNADVPMTPASNMKLLTSGAALVALGADFDFQTRLVLSADGQSLIVVGDGDPAFADPQLLKDMTVGDQKGLDVETFLSFWSKAVVEAGISHINEIIVDDRVFDREPSLKSWPGDEPNRYCPQIAGFNFYGNVVEFFPKPRPGQPPEIGASRPHAPWLKVTNAASSRTGGNDKNDLWIARKPGTNDFTFRGNVRFAYRAAVPVNVNNVPDFFAQLLADRLSKAGVSVGRHRVAAVEDPVSTGRTIGPVIHTPISTVLARCNRNSDNLYAESLVKRIGFAMTGEPGSWTNGTAIIRHILHHRLSDSDLLTGNVIVDGSGLSSTNKITARLMTAWLDNLANDEKLGPVFIESLATGGQPNSTLKDRLRPAQLRGATVQAKTGYINQVSCLSGYVTAPDGRRRSFSVLINGLREGIAPAKALQDQIAAAIAEDLASSAVTLGSD